MSDIRKSDSASIGRKVFIEIADNEYGYGRANLKWVEGVIAGRFVGGDVLVSYDEGDKYTQESIENIAFTKDEEVPPRVSVKMYPAKPQDTK